MLALTLWPEWAAAFPGVPLRSGRGLVASPFDKTIENRHYPPPAVIRPLGGRPGEWFALHAGKYIGGRPRNEGAVLAVIDMARAAGWAVRDVDVAEETITLAKGEQEVVMEPSRIVRSAIVALVRVVRVAPPQERAPWKVSGQWGWCLEVRPLSQPVPASGAQGLWRVPEPIPDRVLALAAPEPTRVAA